jgi:F-type H+-transporting ATPase subunit epsilon
METTGKKVRCVIVTPERAVLDQSADFVALPLYDGELGVLPGRAPLIGRLGIGELRLTVGPEVKRYYIDGGFVQVRDDVVSLLTTRAVEADKLNKDAAESALEEAKKPAPTPKAQEEALKAQERARAQIRIAERAHGVSAGGH